MCRRTEIHEKIMARVDIDPETGCWNWTGPTSGDGRGGGYARMSLNGQTVAVHIVMFTNVYGYIPGKKQLDHKCKNRRCVNPAHLEMVTHLENQKRKKKCLSPPPLESLLGSLPNNTLPLPTPAIRSTTAPSSPPSN